MELRRPEIKPDRISGFLGKRQADSRRPHTMELTTMQKALRKERPTAAGKEHHAQNLHAQDLRSTLDWLREQDDLIEKPDDVNKWVVPIRHTTYEPVLTVGSGIRCVSGLEFDGGLELGYD